jgi:hypothetical protein
MNRWCRQTSNACTNNRPLLAVDKIERLFYYMVIPTVKRVSLVEPDLEKEKQKGAKHE